MHLRMGIGVLVAAVWLGGQAAAMTPGQEFSFEMREGLLWVEVRTAAAAEPLHFLLDTGAGVSVMNLSTVQRLGLHLANRVRVQGVGASTTGYWPQRLSARAGAVPLPKRYLAVDLSELSQACKCRVDGLIGADFFADRVVQIDFKHNQVRLLPTAPVPKEGVAVPLRAGAGAWRVPVRINGQPDQWLRLDTGCASSLQWVTNVRAKPSEPYQVAVALTGLAIPTTQTEVELGRFHFPAVPTGLHDKPLFAEEAGLLGNGLLTRFSTLTLDAKAGRLWLEKF